jgi:predicted nucleic acid-binding protein
VIAGETKGQTAADLPASLRLVLGPETLALSTVSVVELEHGIWGAKDAAQAIRRRQFFDDIFAAVPSYPPTFGVGKRAGRIGAEAKSKGRVIPFQDLPIGSAALEYGYAVATLSVRHFALIQGLAVQPASTLPVSVAGT